MTDLGLSRFDLARPIILLGRGGSGTRLASQLASGLGVFLGTEVNQSGDSVEWVDTLYELAVEACATDILPGSERDLYWIERLRDKALTVMAPAAGRPWGWKLPETMLAIGPVLRAFPNARTVHLVRHPVTSALRRTHVTSRLDNAIGQAVLQAAYRALGWEPARALDDETYIHNATTWRFQIERVAGALLAARTPNLQIRYEDLCRDPGKARADLACFVGLTDPSASALAVDWTRANLDAGADTRADRVWSICGETAAALGYTRHDQSMQDIAPIAD